MDLPNQGIDFGSPALQADSLTTGLSGTGLIYTPVSWLLAMFLYKSSAVFKSDDLSATEIYKNKADDLGFS